MFNPPDLPEWVKKIMMHSVTSFVAVCACSIAPGNNHLLGVVAVFPMVLAVTLWVAEEMRAAIWKAIVDEIERRRTERRDRDA